MVGIGTLLLTPFRIEWDLSEAFWAGLCGVVCCLQLYHFFRPIDIFIAELVVVMGFVGAFNNRRALANALRQKSRIGFWPAACYVVAVAILAARCAGQVVHYDTGFYGSTVVRWFTTYPLVPGLTNLHRQIGLNSNVFLFVAFLNQAPLPHLGFHLFVGMLLCILFVQVIKNFLHVFFGRHQSIVDYFSALLVIPCIFWALNGDLVGTNTDLPTTVISMVGVISLLGALEVIHDKTQASPNRIESRLLIASMLFALAVTFKISSLVLAGLGWVMVLVRFVSLEIPTRRKRTLIMVSVGLSSALVIPWLVRGIVLSGYPFYPSSAFAFPVDWRVPALDADFMALTNRAWARIAHGSFAETSGMHWLKPWFSVAVKNRVNFVIPVALSLLGLLLLLRGRTLKGLFWLWLLLPSLCGVLFWFLAAPSFRFGETAIWTTAACLGVIPIRALSTMNRNVTRLSLTALVALAGWCSYPRTIWRVSFKPLRDLHEFMQMPNARTSPYALSSGLTVQVPIDTNQCWEAKLPCSPYFADNLQLRRDAHLRWGFRIEPSELSLNYDKFTPLHRRYVAAKPTEPVCLNCHLESK